jgi:hypothetical protein
MVLNLISLKSGMNLEFNGKSIIVFCLFVSDNKFNNIKIKRN